MNNDEKVLNLLVLAGHVTSAKVDQARDLIKTAGAASPIAAAGSRRTSRRTPAA